MSSFKHEMGKRFLKSLLVLILIGILSHLISELTYSPQTKQPDPWHNKDLRRSSVDIKTLDYETGTITYRDYKSPKTLYNIEIEESSSIDIEELIDLNID